MKISVDWLNDLLTKPLSTSEMADALELAGIEVEEVVANPPLDEQIVVGKILEVKPHPNADKLKLTKVDVGSEVLGIVCGAPNVAENQLVPVAQMGTLLPDGTKIGASTIRGEESQGMLCSERELGVSQNHDGILQFDAGVEIGQKVAEIIKPTDVIDVKSAANRWDLNSLIGVAHEVAAQADQPVKRDFQNEDSKPVDVGGAKAATQAAVHDIELAPRYMLALLTVDPKLPSPQWLKDRLQAQGVRSISAVVDVTNYVMLEYGQPLHAFDAAKIEGQIQVRRARKGEKLTTLDGVDRTLTDEDIVIADEKQALGLAGVMGGANSEIDDSTTEVLLEAASFNPVALRKTAVRYGLRTDASARFERGLPIELQPYGLFAAIQLLQEHAGGKLITNPADVVKNTEPQSVIEVQNQRVNKLLGLELSGQEMQKELKKLNFESQASEGEDSFKVTIPWWRPDVTHEADIAEEVIKLVGHDKLPSTIPSLRRQTMQFDQRWAPLWNAKDVLRSLGLFEVSTYSFIGEHLIDDLGFKADMHFKLKNPLSSEQAYLRRTLLPSLLATAEKNRNYNKNFGMFEFSRTFWKQGEGELPVEPTYLGVITVVQDGAYASVKRVLDRLTREFKVELEIKPGAFHPVAAHPTRSAQLLLNGDQVGICGQLHPALVRKKKISGEVGFLELDWPRFVAASKPVAARPLSRYPQITRDIAVLVDRGVLWRDVAHELADYQPEFLNDYYGEDLPKHQKSLALRLTFGAEDHTLTDAEADNLEQQVIKRLQQKFNAVLR